MALQTLALMQGEGVKPNVISYNRDLPELGSLSWSWRIYQKTWVHTCSTRGHGHIFGFFIPSPVTGGPVGRAFWGHTSETSTLVWWIFWPPTPRNNGWLLRWFIIGFTKDAALLQLHFLGNFEGMKLSHFRHHQCCGRCVSMAKSFGTFCSSAARDLGWGMHGDASKNEFRLCSSSTQRLVQQIKGFKPFFSVVNCSALMGRWITVEISPWHLCPSICIHLLWLGLTWRLGK